MSSVLTEGATVKPSGRLTELEGLLVACLERDEQKQRLRIDSAALAVVADWQEENGSDPDLADSVRLAVEGSLDGALPPHSAAMLDGREGRKIFLTVRRKGRARDRTVVLDLWELWPDHTRTDLWKEGAPFAADPERQMELIEPHLLMARWHAVVHVLGYSPLMLLACCGAEASGRP